MPRGRVVWEISILSKANKYQRETHFARPTIEPETTIFGIWHQSHDAIYAIRFPVEAAQALAGETVRWRLVCTRRLTPKGAVVIAFRAGAFVQDALVSTTCPGCRQWGHRQPPPRYPQDYDREELARQQHDAKWPSNP